MCGTQFEEQVRGSSNIRKSILKCLVDKKHNEVQRKFYYKL